MSFLTRDLPGSGGALLAAPEDFIVEEIPAYEPSGEGEHAFVLVEKTGLTTPEAIRRVAKAAGVREADVGRAGMKDKHTRARQWLSFAWPMKRELPDLSSVAGPELEILELDRHDNKLKRGHLRGNRFTITVRGVPAGGVERARAILDVLRAQGVPNGFGPQRFGRHGDNAVEARRILRGERPPPRDPRVRTLIFSALQSEAFNAVLERRIARGLFARALAGDWMQKHGTGGIFECTDPAIDQARVDALEISPTGPMPGRKAFRASGEPGAIEAEVLAELGLDDETTSRLEEGTRRALRFTLDTTASVEPGPRDDSYVVSFVLPPGAYATIVLGELIKPEGGVVLREETVD